MNCSWDTAVWGDALPPCTHPPFRRPSLLQGTPAEADDFVISQKTVAQQCVDMTPEYAAHVLSDVSSDIFSGASTPRVPPASELEDRKPPRRLSGASPPSALKRRETKESRRGRGPAKTREAGAEEAAESDKKDRQFKQFIRQRFTQLNRVWPAPRAAVFIIGRCSEKQGKKGTEQDIPVISGGDLGEEKKEEEKKKEGEEKKEEEKKKEGEEKKEEEKKKEGEEKKEEEKKEGEETKEEEKKKEGEETKEEEKKKEGEEKKEEEKKKEGEEKKEEEKKKEGEEKKEPEAKKIDLSQDEAQDKLADQLVAAEKSQCADDPAGTIVQTALILSEDEQKCINAQVERWTKLVIHISHTDRLFFKFANFFSKGTLKVRLYCIAFYENEDPNYVSLLSGHRTKLARPEVHPAHPMSRIRCKIDQELVLPFDASSRGFYLGVVAVMGQKKKTGEGEFRRKLIGMTELIDARRDKIRLRRTVVWALFVPQDLVEHVPTPQITGEIFFSAEGFEGDKGPPLPKDSVLRASFDFGGADRLQAQRLAKEKQGKAPPEKPTGFFQRLFGGRQKEEHPPLKPEEYARFLKTSLGKIPVPATHKPGFLNLLDETTRPDDAVQGEPEVLRIVRNRMSIVQNVVVTAAEPALESQAKREEGQASASDGSAPKAAAARGKPSDQSASLKSSQGRERTAQAADPAGDVAAGSGRLGGKAKEAVSGRESGRGATLAPPDRASARATKASAGGKKAAESKGAGKSKAGEATTRSLQSPRSEAKSKSGVTAAGKTSQGGKQGGAPAAGKQSNSASPAMKQPNKSAASSNAKLDPKSAAGKKGDVKAATPPSKGEGKQAGSSPRPKENSRTAASAGASKQKQTSPAGKQAPKAGKIAETKVTAPPPVKKPASVASKGAGAKPAAQKEAGPAQAKKDAKSVKAEKKATPAKPVESAPKKEAAGKAVKKAAPSGPPKKA
ncbi:UNVERIFIED_CONTAM: hypothetical protein HHA_257300 [Hammondia hammondi]|eukprot:XP_008883251.1 hypothetical protein HHA_257300 [Hammondia hammondi]